MRYKNNLFSAILVLILLVLLTAGCQNKKDEIPFTSLNWGAAVEEVTALEGSEYETYASVYGGDTYTYSKEYQNLPGTIKYMFDDKNSLVCVAWAYETDSMDNLTEVYNTLHQQIVDAHGESGYNAANDTSYGDVWYLESGDILISAVTLSDQMALQYAYLSPVVSNPQNK